MDAKDGDRRFSFRLFREMKREWAWLFGYIKKYRAGIALNVLFGLAGAVTGLLSGVASKYLIDAVIGKSGTILKCAVLVASLAVGQIVLQALASRASSVIGAKAGSEVRASVFDHMMNARLEDISAYHSGELVNRLEGDVSSVIGGVVGLVPNTVIRVTQFVGALIIVLYYDPVMAAIALVSAPVMFLSSRYMMRMIRKFNMQSRELNGRILSCGEEAAQNLQTVKAFGVTRDYAAKFGALLDSYRRVRLCHDKFTILTTMCLSVIGLLVSYSCYGWSVYRLWSGDISFGTMTLFLQICSTLTSSFSAMVGLLPGAVSVATSAGRIMEITSLECETDADEEAALELVKNAEGDGIRITAENVGFCYSDAETPVLRDASFTAKSGDIIALVGPSGEGKTTLLKLILGLMKPTDGAVYFESGAIRLSASDSTRRLCSYVPQGNSMFSGTIEENLRLAAPDAAESELWEALDVADIGEFVRSLPDGLSTKMGERGLRLSEGQAQRIAIARALLRKAPVLLMDEITSALDHETEARVLHNLMNSDPDRVCILTTHRKGILKYCSSIYRIDKTGRLTSAADLEAAR